LAAGSFAALAASHPGAEAGPSVPIGDQINAVQKAKDQLEGMVKEGAAGLEAAIAAYDARLGELRAFRNEALSPEARRVRWNKEVYDGERSITAAQARLADYAAQQKVLAEKVREEQELIGKKQTKVAEARKGLADTAAAPPVGMLQQVQGIATQIAAMCKPGDTALAQKLQELAPLLARLGSIEAEAPEVQPPPRPANFLDLGGFFQEGTDGQPLHEVAADVTALFDDMEEEHEDEESSHHDEAHEHAQSLFTEFIANAEKSGPHQAKAAKAFVAKAQRGHKAAGAIKKHFGTIKPGLKHTVVSNGPAGVAAAAAAHGDGHGAGGLSNS